ncbi:hypothetical protein SUGI_0025290 [Cryptomeria japonica]|uniref:probable thiol methyltransferase 2 isoform X2 n=1 Tax=Cryptomeria japonica TaxID=3369 RepID=UPI0024089283|nr:probable thiol methyltransferase 2 isoform X2 [Cryptomeria japonica]GLJ05785.1 hypothetical protein SUGI_0025290 [Cryptomeria japonica]
MHTTRFFINFGRSSQLLSLVGNGQVRHRTVLGSEVKLLTVFRNLSSQSINQPTMSAANLERQRKMRQLVNNQPMDAWDKCWVEGAIPWDIGHVTPILSHLIEKGLLPYGRALVPGCGAGYDVVALANHNRYVVGVDISETAIKRAQELAACAPNVEYLEFLKEDFFTWAPTEQFDFIFDYTFFCAFEPQMRPAWAKRVAELLKPDGELLTVIFPVSNHEGGPPYAVSLLQYEKVLHPFGFKATSIENNEMAIERRKGREIVARWKSQASHLSLL